MDNKVCDDVDCYCNRECWESDYNKVSTKGHISVVITVVCILIGGYFLVGWL